MRALLRLRRRLPLPLTARPVSSSSSSEPNEIPTVYSFLQPSIFAPRPKPQPPPPPPAPAHDPAPRKVLAVSDAAALEADLLAAVAEDRSDHAWLAFKSLAAASNSLSPHAAAALVSHLAAAQHRLGLKRAFAAAVFLLEKSPHAAPVPEAALGALFSALAAAGSAAPALALARALLRCGRRLPAFATWGHPLVELTRTDAGAFAAFLKVFDEACKLVMAEKSPAEAAAMRPDLAACNSVLAGCCRILGSVADAERVLETMSAVGVSPDAESFGCLAFLYAWRGVPSRVDELDKLLDALGFSKKRFFKNLVSGYLKAGCLESVSSAVLQGLKERSVEGKAFDEESYNEVTQSFVDNGRIKELAQLIIQAQEIELTQQSLPVEDSVGFGIINACVELGLLNKAHSILDEMTAQGASVGLGVYSSILKAYCKEQKTAEAAQLVAEISAAGVQLDAGSYDALIDASMTAHDFQSAFALFKEMREARLPELKTSYLTIMTGLTENNRPGLMASFLDSVVDDPRIEIAAHDWNSIIHAFCKVGRLEDAKRTYRRMVFLRFEPNNQTYLSLINGYVSAEKYFNVLILWTEVRRKGAEFNHELIDAFLYALVKGGFFDMAMQVIEKAQECKIYIDKWRHKQAFMETHKKLKVAKLRKRNFRKMEALVAFKNWAGLNT